MQLASFQVGKQQYYMSYQKIGMDTDLFIYRGTIHVSKAIEFSCMKIDESPVFIASPITLSDLVEKAIINAITHNELKYDRFD